MSFKITAMNKLKITIVSPCFNEENNIEILYSRIVKAVNLLPKYSFDFIFIDNASTDKTLSILKSLAQKDKRLKIIVNTRNFGHIRSPYWAMLQSNSHATIYLASDLQDPPELIPDFINSWEAGYKVVYAVKPSSEESLAMKVVRRAYYFILSKISDTPLISNATGFGLYDREVLDNIRAINDPYPFFRGLVAELGYEIKQINFDQPKRFKGISKNNFYTLYDIAILGIISHSILPIRLISFTGIAIGFISFIAAILLFVSKIFFWKDIPLGYAPAGILIFTLFGILMITLGILGEYLASIHNYLKKRPIVVEKERINFE
jgi:glycosyltransferase involved in cell wall biosynthesis